MLKPIVTLLSIEKAIVFCFIPRKAKKSKCFPFNLSKSKKSNCFLSGFRVQQTWQSQFCQKNVANLAGASVARKNKQIKQMLVLLEKMKQIKQKPCYTRSENPNNLVYSPLQHNCFVLL